MSEKVFSVVVFHKHMKDEGRHVCRTSPRVSIPIADIRTIAESHIDMTTLVRTSDGGTIAIEETFEVATKMWASALADQARYTNAATYAA